MATEKDQEETSWKKHHGDSLEGQIEKDMVICTEKPR